MWRLSPSANCLLSVVFPRISSVLPVAHTEGCVPRGYPAYASSLTSHLLVIRRRVVPALQGTRARTYSTYTHTPSAEWCLKPQEVQTRWDRQTNSVMPDSGINVLSVAACLCGWVGGGVGSFVPLQCSCWVLIMYVIYVLYVDLCTRLAQSCKPTSRQLKIREVEYEYHPQHFSLQLQKV